MSFFELLVVLVVIILVVKPDDIPQIINTIGQFYSQLVKFKSSLFSQFRPNDVLDQAEDMNFYLEQICNIEGKYDGEYDIVSIKHKYDELVKLHLKEHFKEHFKSHDK